MVVAASSLKHAVLYNVRNDGRKNLNPKRQANSDFIVLSESRRGKDWMPST